MLPSSIKDETDLVSTAVRVLYLQHYCQLVTVVITLYDHFITFHQESTQCRYAGDCTVLVETYGSELNWSYLAIPASGVWGHRAIALGAFTCTLTTQLILQFRIQALYGSRTLSRCLTVVYASGVIGLLTIGGVSVGQMRVTSEPVPGVYQCTCVKFPPYSPAYWCIILFFDTLLFSLAIGVVGITWCRLSSEPAVSSLVAIVLRDNFGYYFVGSRAFATYLTTAIVWIVAETRYVSIPALFSYAVSTIMSSRLILNLCDAYHNPPDDASYSYYFTTRGTSEWDTRRPWETSGTSRRVGAATPPQAQPTPDVGLTSSVDDMELSTVSEHWRARRATNVNGGER
ncbi:hypothetical protein P691DRAFT_784209 [Macrolepiota fuliginosa MF-IS2]|uniref:Uncharacterized protein n=1 Tax=Macrolepiota fuliginosa MF-IS2 TaxID=1400762 RepID=A0A9P6C7Z5_9AGAR|nr:hypothetical protein P691DRAFT_784209 [Macrolepiota fuliginosa MF-IS2]